MKATARIVAGPDRLEELRSGSPLTFRATSHGVYLVGSAAGPIGGDEFGLHIEVLEGADLTLRSSAAAVVLPGPHDETSRFTITASVARDATLRWLPEPCVATGGCRHVMDTQLTVHPSATVHWREEVILGREGEISGCWTTNLSVLIGDRPLLRHAQRYGQENGWDGPSVVGDAKAVGSHLVIGDELPVAAPDPSAAVMRLGPRAALTMTVAADAPALRPMLTDAVPRTGIPSPAR